MLVTALVTSLSLHMLTLYDQEATIRNTNHNIRVYLQGRIYIYAILISFFISPCNFFLNKKVISHFIVFMFFHKLIIFVKLHKFPSTTEKKLKSSRFCFCLTTTLLKKHERIRLMYIYRYAYYDYTKDRKHK